MKLEAAPGSEPVGRVFVCRTSDVRSGEMKECHIPGGPKVLVINSENEYFACQAICPHQGVPLSEGFCDGAVLTCSQHFWQWDVRTGDPVGSAELPLPCYAVTLEGDSVYIAEAALAHGD